MWIIYRSTFHFSSFQEANVRLGTVITCRRRGSCRWQTWDGQRRRRPVDVARLSALYSVYRSVAFYSVYVITPNLNALAKEISLIYSRRHLFSRHDCVYCAGSLFLYVCYSFNAAHAGKVSFFYYQRACILALRMKEGKRIERTKARRNYGRKGAGKKTGKEEVRSNSKV